MMPLTYSIAEGIVFGMLSYVLLKVLSGKFKDVSVIMYVLGVFRLEILGIDYNLFQIYTIEKGLSEFWKGFFYSGKYPIFGFTTKGTLAQLFRALP